MPSVASPATIRCGKAGHGSAQAFGHRQKIEAAKFARKDVSAAAGKFQDVVELPGAEVGIDLVGDGADQLERKERHRELDPVRQLHGDDIAAPDADAAIKFGAAEDLVLQRAVADAAPRVREDLAIGMRRGGLVDEFEEGLVSPQARRRVALREFGSDHVHVGHCAPLSEDRGTGRRRPGSRSR